MLTPDHEYYRNQGRKSDGNIYLKGDYRLTRNLNAYADIQYRHISYDIDGCNDKWNDATDALQQLSEHHKELTLIVIAHRDSSLKFCDRIVTI